MKAHTRMPWMVRKLVSAALVLAGLGLIGSQLAGLLFPPDFRDHFNEKTVSYETALEEMDAAFAAAGPAPGFLERAVAIYDAATVYQWPPGITRISFTDNWVLWTAAWADPLMKQAGVTDLDDPFSAFETVSYERALRRGFGICSQNALGLADLLDRRYGIETHMIGLDGHVVAEATLSDGSRYLLDPSVGVFLPFGLDQAARQSEPLRASYMTVGHPKLADAYDAAGNIRMPEPGARAFRPKLSMAERASEVLKWVVPALSVAVGFWAWPRRRRSRPGSRSTC